MTVQEKCIKQCKVKTKSVKCVGLTLTPSVGETLSPTFIHQWKACLIGYPLTYQSPRQV